MHILLSAWPQKALDKRLRHALLFAKGCKSTRPSNQPSAASHVLLRYGGGNSQHSYVRVRVAKPVHVCPAPQACVQGRIPVALRMAEGPGYAHSVVEHVRQELQGRHQCHEGHFAAKFHPAARPQVPATSLERTAAEAQVQTLVVRHDHLSSSRFKMAQGSLQERHTVQSGRTFVGEVVIH